MRPSVARASEQLDPRHADIPPPQSATLGLHPVARTVLLIVKTFLQLFCFARNRGDLTSATLTYQITIIPN